MTGSLSGKVAIVTGGSRGIGRAIAESLALDGAAVVINYAANVVAAADTVRAITASGARADSIRADIAEPRSAAEIFAFAEQALQPCGHTRVQCRRRRGDAAHRRSPRSDYDRIFRGERTQPGFLLQAAAASLNDRAAESCAISSTIAAFRGGWRCTRIEQGGGAARSPRLAAIESRSTRHHGELRTSGHGRDRK